MNMPRRPLLAALGLAALSLAPHASAAFSPAPADAVSFAGTFHTSCTMPSLPGPQSGPYSCTHTAHALACAGIADSGQATTWIKVCDATLTRGKTAGDATHAVPGASEWTCDNGTGTGTFAYQPSPTEPTFRVPVTLVVLGHTVIVNGSYVQRGTGRTMVVRARFPAVCNGDTQIGGYEGTVTPQ